MKSNSKKLDPQQALAFFQQGKLNEAKNILENIVRQSPQFANGWFILGIINAKQQNLSAAEKAMQQAIKHQQHYPDAYNNLGVIYDKLQKYNNANQAYIKAIEQNPNYTQAYFNLANNYQTQGDIPHAMETYLKTLKLDPEYVDALINLGTIYQQLRNNDKAIECFQKALVKAPDDVTLLNNIGLSYFYLFDYNTALDYFQKALLIAPGLSSGFINIAHVLQSRQEYAAAKQYFNKAAQDSELKYSALNNIGLMELGLLNLKEGWSHYHYRISIADVRAHIPDTIPSDLSDKNILVCKDQGLGDEIFFLRFISALEDLGAKVTYSADPRLLTLLQRSLNKIKIIDSKPVQSEYDFVLPVSELPRLLHDSMTEKYPKALKLIPNENTVENLLKTTPNNGKKNIAVTWQAGTEESNKLFKRIEPELIGKLLYETDANIFILQRNPSKNDIKKLEKTLGRKAFNFSYLNDDLEDVLAFLSLVDNYLSVSNTNVHLFAGLNKTADIFIPYPPEWRWTFDKATSPWFPNFSLYRQDLSGNWQNALELYRSNNR